MSDDDKKEIKDEIEFYIQWLIHLYFGIDWTFRLHCQSFLRQ
jgi:hypothetical protein